MSTSVGQYPTSLGQEAQSTTASWAGPAFVRGEGCWLFDQSNERYFDASAGSGALNLGHTHPLVVEAIVRQVSRLVHAGCKVQSEPRRKLVERLGTLFPYERPTILPTVTGAEAVEAALKMVRASTGRRRVVALERSYHGKSTGSLSVTWRSDLKRHTIIDPTSATIVAAPFSESDVPASVERLRVALEEMEKAGDPAAAVLVEPIQATEGVWVLPKTFLAALTEVAREFGALVIFDEIYTGMGRCGTMFYYEQTGVLPDILLIGKALANGLPIGAVVGPERIVNALASGHHTSTFAGYPLACAVGLEVLRVFSTMGVVQSVGHKNAQLSRGLTRLSESLRRTSAPRGAGLMIGFDCLDERGRPSAQAAAAFGRQALKERLVCSVGGYAGASVRLTPPLTTTERELADLLERIERTVDALRREN